MRNPPEFVKIGERSIKSHPSLIPDDPPVPQLKPLEIEVVLIFSFMFEVVSHPDEFEELIPSQAVLVVQQARYPPGLWVVHDVAEDK